MIEKGTRLYASHRRDTIVLPWGVFILWLVCGHHGGMGKGGEAVTKRRCWQCGGLKKVVRFEPCHE